MSKLREVLRARRAARIQYLQQSDVEGLGPVRIELAPKTKAELQDELTAAGVEYPSKATKADLEKLAAGVER